MEKQQPKKRREIWPYAIVGAIVIFIGSILYAISVMSAQDVPLVSRNYYEQEIDYQSQIDKEQRALQNAPDVSFSRDNGRGAWLAFNDSQPVVAGEGNVTFFRPSDESLDFRVPVNPDSQGMQWIDLSQARSGLWVVQVEWKEGEDMYYHETQLLVQE